MSVTMIIIFVIVNCGKKRRREREEERKREREREKVVVNTHRMSTYDLHTPQKLFHSCATPIDLHVFLFFFIYALHQKYSINFIETFIEY